MIGQRGDVYETTSRANAQPLRLRSEWEVWCTLGHMTMTEQPGMGRRERKKAATRAAISDAALRLFLARGYDHVSVKDVAEAADVAVTTLFQHFPGKEALVFDQDEDREAALVAAVTERPAGESVLEALQRYFQSAHSLTLDASLKDFLELVHSTPALREYARRMWTRHEVSLARAIVGRTNSPADDVAAAALARFTLEALNLAGEQPDPPRALREIFARLRDGWGEYGATPPARPSTPRAPRSAKAPRKTAGR